MKRLYGGASLLVALFFMLLLSTPLHALNGVPDVSPNVQAPIDDTFHEPLSRGLDLVFSDRFEEALTVFDSLQQEYPDHPAPYFYRAATYQSWMSSYRFSGFQKELEENVQLAIDKGNKLIENDSDPWLKFYVGAAYGYRAFYRFREHNWIGAYTDGKKGISNFEEALEVKPELYDCYLGLGSYHYWRTARSKFIRVVAFWMKDRREMGLNQIKFSIEHGRYCPHEALMGLIIAYYDYGEYDKARKLVDRALDISDPPLIAALYMDGRLADRAGDWPRVEKRFDEILQRLKVHPYPSIGYQVETSYWLAKAYYKQNRPEAALKMTQVALDLDKKRVPETELENPVDDYDDIKTMLEELDQEIKNHLFR